MLNVLYITRIKSKPYSIQAYPDKADFPLTAESLWWSRYTYGYVTLVTDMLNIQCFLT